MKYIARPYAIEAEEITDEKSGRKGDYLISEPGKDVRIVPKAEFERKYIIHTKSPHSAGR